MLSVIEITENCWPSKWSSIANVCLSDDSWGLTSYYFEYNWSHWRVNMFPKDSTEKYDFFSLQDGTRMLWRQISMDLLYLYYIQIITHFFYFIWTNSCLRHPSNCNEFLSQFTSFEWCLFTRPQRLYRNVNVENDDFKVLTDFKECLLHKLRNNQSWEPILIKTMFDSDSDTACFFYVR